MGTQREKDRGICRVDKLEAGTRVHRMLKWWALLPWRQRPWSATLSEPNCTQLSNQQQCLLVATLLALLSVTVSLAPFLSPRPTPRPRLRSLLRSTVSLRETTGSTSTSTVT